MFKNTKIRDLVMKSINERIDNAQKIYEDKCGRINDELIEELERIRVEAKSQKEKVAEELVNSIIH